jgi:5-methylcytosine-specific restriction endonuclease McrA
VDHIQPIAKGGLHHPDNLQILTMEENRKKWMK